MLGEDGKMIRDATEEIEKKATPGNFFEIDIEKTLNYRDTGEWVSNLPSSEVPGTLGSQVPGTSSFQVTELQIT